MFGWDDAIAEGLKIIDRFIPDENAKAQAAAQLKQAMFDAQAKAEADQRAANTAEASNPSVFVAGWRPAVGWLCVITLGYTWIFAPVVSWAVKIHWVEVPPLPTLGAADSQTLLYALLGIGSLRTAEKFGGVETSSVGGGVIGAVTDAAKSVARGLTGRGSR